MTSEQKPGKQKRPLFSPIDLKQVRDAVHELRASAPHSVLADLVEEKLRSIELHHAKDRFDLRPRSVESS